MFRLLLVIAMATVVPAAGYGWGIEGHQIVADIAEAYLTPAARKQVDTILNGARMRDVANYADEIRPFRPETARWHYVNVTPGEKTFSWQRDCQEIRGQGDCVLAAINRSLTLLGNSSAPPETKALELKYLIHFIADAHQPFHAVTEGRGGNDFRVVFFGTPSNLHRVWDVELIRRMGPPEQISARLIECWKPESQRDPNRLWGVPVDWTMQARDIGLNALVSNGTELDQAYFDRFAPAVDEQLMLAGARLASLLNQRLR